MYTDGVEETPVAVAIKSRLHRDELHSRYGGCGRFVYIRNKNLQALPRKQRGAIVWLPGMGIIGIVVAAMNAKARVKIAHPKARAGDIVPIEDLGIDGCYLQQILGRPVGCFNQAVVKKSLDETSGEVTTLIDNEFCVKMCIDGPDNVFVSEAVSSKEVKDFLKGNELAIRNTGSLPKRQRHIEGAGEVSVRKDVGIVGKKKSSRLKSRKTRQKKQLGKPIPRARRWVQKNGETPVVYVYRQDPSGFTSVEEEVPLFTIPIGKASTIDKNKRFVLLLFDCAV